MAENREGSARTYSFDPPHITEFASERYFEKLRQQEQQHQSSDQQNASATTTVPSSSTFILPLRESKVSEPEAAKATEQKKDKFSRFSSFRQRVTQLHSSKSIADADTSSLSLPVRASTDSARRSLPLDQLFQALPNELQIQIISSLPLNDVLNLRLASKNWHALITLNETPIVRYHLDNHIPAYALRLYPIKEASDANLHNLCGLWHRLHVAAKLSHLMCEWITKDIFLRQTEAQRTAFAPQQERMRRRLIPLLFTTFHFFEQHRKLHLEHLNGHSGHGLSHEPYTLNPIEKEILEMYDDQTLLRVHEVFPLVISSFCRRLRPPTYVGRVERSLRGYLKEKPSDDIHAAILCIGGLRQVERLWEIKGYNHRRNAVDQWYNGLTKEPEIPMKERRGLMNFGRRKSSTADRNGRLSFDRARSPSCSIDGFDPNLVFHTSLAAGMPMSPLHKDNAQSLLGDLPVLQQIWLTTAEAMILDRGIVERTCDIKRNQQVMLDLIREDGIDEEDEWWYGRGNPESVRPEADAIHDDAD